MLFELHFVKFGIKPPIRQEFIVGTAFYDTAGLDSYNPVGMEDSGESVGYHECRSVYHEIIEGLLNHLLTLGVQGAGCFVENQYRSILEDSPRNAEPLPLTAGK